MKKRNRKQNQTAAVLRNNTLRVVSGGGSGCYYKSVYYSDGSIIEMADGEDHRCDDGQWM